MQLFNGCGSGTGPVADDCVVVQWLDENRLMLDPLAGIDPSICPQRYDFGEDGKPHYFQGPNESPAQAMAIAQRVREAGGYFTVAVPGSEEGHLAALEDESDEDEYEWDDDTDAPRWKWRDPGPGGRR